MSGSIERKRRLFLEALEDRRLLAGVPQVTVNAPAEQFMGEPFSFTAEFDNVAAGPTDTGYGPFVDLVFPVNGVDGMAGTDIPDGISFLSATYLGAAGSRCPTVLGKPAGRRESERQ